VVPVIVTFSKTSRPPIRALIDRVSEKLLVVVVVVVVVVVPVLAFAAAFAATADVAVLEPGTKIAPKVKPVAWDGVCDPDEVELVLVELVFWVVVLVVDVVDCSCCWTAIATWNGLDSRLLDPVPVTPVVEAAVDDRPVDGVAPTEPKRLAAVAADTLALDATPNAVSDADWLNRLFRPIELKRTTLLYHGVQ